MTFRLFKESKRNQFLHSQCKPNFHQKVTSVLASAQMILDEGRSIVSPLGHPKLSWMIFILLFPSMSARSIRASTPQSVQYM